MTSTRHASGGLRATLLGGVAVLMWALLALFTAASGQVPPFQLAAMCFAIATLAGVLKRLWFRERLLANFRFPAQVWITGVGGLFGYHFFYFMALRNAPAVEASLIAYLWPLLIVLFSAMLPGERLRWFHLAGGTLGLAGVWLLTTGGEGLALRSQYALGYAAAMFGALTWSGYSVLNRRLARVPTDAVGSFCAATAVLALLCHLLFEITVWPTTPLEWLAVLGLGLGPVGTAFFFWDHGVKHGDIQTLGIASYGAPLLSTLILIVAGLAPLTWTVILACLLITSGGVLGAGNLLSPSQRTVYDSSSEDGPAA